MMDNSIEALERQIVILKKKLERSEESRMLIEQAKDHYDLVYRSSINKLDAQKNLLDMQNRELDIVRMELLGINKELSDARKSAEQANEAKSRFLANMSHEIRTPLNGILGFLELLELSPLNEEQKRYLQEVNSASEILLFLINDILDFSKIEAGQMTLESIPFNLTDVIENAAALVKPKALKKGVSLEIHIDPALPSDVNGDPTRLHQVLNNLLSNGVKFTEQGLVRLAVVSAGNNGDMHEIEFEVQDSGIGIKEEEIKRLFSPFVQADTSITRKYGGTGLGLVISKELVRIMGGSIQAASGYLGGAIFRFRIPFKVQEDYQKSSIIQPWRAGTDGLFPEFRPVRVLLAEDNDTNVHLMELMLKRAGLPCDSVNNGIQAVEACRLIDYDLILMDCQMPEMDGFQATRNIRTLNNKSSGAVIIALTANAMASDRDECLASGMNDYLAKPISGSVFYPMLTRYLDVISEQKTQKLAIYGDFEAESIEKVSARLANDLSCDIESLQELVRDFIDRLLPMTDNLLACVKGCDLDRTGPLLHQIIGASGNMRFSSAYGLTNLISEAVEADEWDKAEIMTKDLVHYAEWLKQESRENDIRGGYTR